MPPDVRVEPLQSIADDRAVRNDHMSCTIILERDWGQVETPDRSFRVVAGLVPATLTIFALCLRSSGRRAKPGDDASA